jgi:hypothetical protein
LLKEVEMAGDGGTVESPLCKKRNLMPCETPGCSESCAYAYSCHEKRMGRQAIFWPGIALIGLLAIAVISLI